MKVRLTLVFFSTLLILFGDLYAYTPDTKDDLFGLELVVEAPFPDEVDDGVTMDTVRTGYDIRLSIYFENKTPYELQNLHIDAFFPNQLAKYTRLIWADKDPYQIDPDSSIGANWIVESLEPFAKDSINFILLADRAPADTLYFTYIVDAYIQGGNISERAHTNIYVPGGHGVNPYPDIWISKTVDINTDTVFMRDTLSYEIQFANQVENSMPVHRIVINDTLPPGFTFESGGNIAFSDFSVEETENGRELLTWKINQLLQFDEIKSINYKTIANFTTTRDSISRNGAYINSRTYELILHNNTAFAEALVKPKFDLELQPQYPNYLELDRTEIHSFAVICENNSEIDLGLFQVKVEIEDNENPNIFSISNINHSGSFQGNSIMWTVTGLAAQETIQLEFDISFDNILEAKDYTIQFDALVDTLVNLDDGDHLDFDTENNADSWSISVDATPDYKIFLDSDKNSIYTGDVVNFSIKCENSQVIPLQNPRCRIYIDDSVPGSNLYSLDFGTGTANIQQNFIEWELPLLEPNQSETINLTLTFDQVDMMNNYNISLIATIDSVENNASLFSDNESRKQIYLDGTPNLEIKLNETENRHETFPDSTLYFTVSCENKSSPMIDDAKVFLWINENNTIYSILPGSLTISATNDSIFWNLSALGKDESSSENFQLLFNGINTHNDYNLALTAETDFPNQSDDDSTDNRSSYQVSVDATPELTIEIEEQNDKYMVEPNDILKFNLVCQNTSFSTYNSLQVQAAISGDKIYKIVSATGNIVQGEEDQISWTIPPLLMNETATVPFDLIFDNIPDVRDYTVIITGLISLPDYDFDWAQDSKQKTITTNVNVDVSIGNITCNPASPSLNTMLDYSIPVYNNGNYPARNAVLTIERPEYTDLNYYILNGSKYVFSDSSSSTGQIDLGDLEPNYDNTIQVGLRVHSFKELPSHVHNHFRLDFLSTISFEGGDDVSRSLVRDVYFDPAVADLFLDKNIVEPGELPLVVTFKSSDFGDLDIKVYNLAGEFIKTIHSGSVEKGDTYLFDWYGDNKQNMPVSSGVYFIHAYTKFYQGIKKVIVVR